VSVSGGSFALRCNGMNEMDSRIAALPTRRDGQPAVTVRLWTTHLCASVAEFCAYYSVHL
jgi:hypothetical protein